MREEDRGKFRAQAALEQLYLRHWHVHHFKCNRRGPLSSASLIGPVVPTFLRSAVWSPLQC